MEPLVFLIVLAICVALVSSAVNDSLCLSRNGTMQSLLDGIYYGEATLQNDFNTVEYKRNGKWFSDLYLFYDDGKWLLSANDYSQTNRNIHAYCAGGESDTLTPQCTGCWVFYWAVHKPYLIEDCSVTLSTDLTACESTFTPVSSYKDALCINDLDDTDAATNQIQFGEYILTDDDNGIYHRIPDNDMVIWHDGRTNVWLVGADKEHPLLLCHDRDGVPGQCYMWHEEKSASKHTESLSITVECVFKSKSNSSDGEDGAIAIVIILLLLFIGGGVFWWCKYKKGNKGQARISEEDEDKRGTDTQMIQQSDFVTSDKPEMISVTDVDDKEEEEDVEDDNVNLTVDDIDDADTTADEEELDSPKDPLAP
eukprot:64157_1